MVVRRFELNILTLTIKTSLFYVCPCRLLFLHLFAHPGVMCRTTSGTKACAANGPSQSSRCCVWWWPWPLLCSSCSSWSSCSLPRACTASRARTYAFENAGVCVCAAAKGKMLLLCGQVFWKGRPFKWNANKEFCSVSFRTAGDLLVLWFMWKTDMVSANIYITRVSLSASCSKYRPQNSEPQTDGLSVSTTADGSQPNVRKLCDTPPPAPQTHPHNLAYYDNIICQVCPCSPHVWTSHSNVCFLLFVCICLCWIPLVFSPSHSVLSQVYLSAGKK